MKNSKFEFRAMIEFPSKKGCLAKEIHDRLCTVYGYSAPSFSTVTRWFNEFRRGRQSLEYNPRHFRRPSDAVRPFVIAAVKKQLWKTEELRYWKL